MSIQHTTVSASNIKFSNQIEIVVVFYIDREYRLSINLWRKIRLTQFRTAATC